jgi:putative FmdB family regulatory protein
MMPCYTFECPEHGEFDAILHFDELEKHFPCPECGEKSKRVIVLGHGGIIRTGDSVPWVRDAAQVLTDNDHPNPNLQTIQDLRQYYRDHPNIRPAESHPAFPSSFGDALDSSHKDIKHEKEVRSRKGHELIRKMRKLEIHSSAD